ncbi:MAG TPA: carboxypeptidase-like regulatory domain-containing protein [Verrucomicrobiae bacterium]|nr:carboxypeptidase-like regulatory domain-containing protein [Verrucomicrobiae bacterium]
MRPRTISTAIVATVLLTAGCAFAQKDADNEPTASLNFVVLKDDNGKPVKNAAVIMHPVDSRGRQERGDLELKTDPEGKTGFDGLPYGKLRVQVLAQGFQTYGEDFDIEKPKVEITIKLKRPQKQYSIYDDHAGESTTPAKPDNPPPDQKKPN